MEIVKCEAVSKIYGSGAAMVTALNRLSLSVDKGEFVAIVGASGSGKSTLLHLLGGVDKPTSGKIWIDDVDISDLNAEKAAIFRRRKVGLIYQFYNLIPTLTVRTNIMLPMLLDKRKPEQEHFDYIVSTLGLSDKLNSLPSQLSGGQQQRTAIARSLLYRPAIILADEPTGNLDQKNSREVVELLKISNRNWRQTVLSCSRTEESFPTEKSAEKGGYAVMWKEYSLSYIKNNKASCISIAVAALVASLLLSLTCGVFYNIWTDDIRLIKLETGDWHGKLTGNITDDNVEYMECCPNVGKVIVNENDTGGRTVYLYFEPIKTVYEDLPAIADNIGLSADNGSVQFNSKLLEQYFIFSPEARSNPPLVLIIYVLTMLVACFSLVMIIHNAFAVSMNARLHQLGLLQSIGATPRQIRTALTREAFILCLAPIIIGIGLGGVLCLGFVQFVRNVTDSIREYTFQFQYSPYVAAAALFASLLTVWLSARIPAAKMSRITPLEAIQYGKEPPVKKLKRIHLFSRLLGIEGQIADKSLYARRKAFRASTLALTLSFLVLSGYLILNTISSISTNYTFFERYKDKWDLMVTVKEGENDEDALLNGIRSIDGVSKCIAYRRENAYTYISRDMLSEELLSLGGIEALKDTGIKLLDERYEIKAPLIILDDESFLNYCEELGWNTSTSAGSEIPAVITVNTIWDNINSNRINKKLIPFLKTGESLRDLMLSVKMENAVTPVSLNAAVGAAIEFPDIREEFENFTLVQVMSESSFAQISNYFSNSKTCYNIKAESMNAVTGVQKDIINLLDNKYEYTIENRQEVEASNTSIRNVKIILVGALSILLACIGLANVFSSTLGHVQQRRREFARYITIGLTPRGIWKVLCAEVIITGLKPIFYGLLLNIPIALFALRKSMIPFSDFSRKIPVVPVTVFALVIMLSVILANYIGGRKISKLNLVDTLKNDTML